MDGGSMDVFHREYIHLQSYKLSLACTYVIKTIHMLYKFKYVCFSVLTPGLIARKT